MKSFSNPACPSEPYASCHSEPFASCPSDPFASCHSQPFPLCHPERSEGSRSEESHLAQAKVGEESSYAFAGIQDDNYAISDYEARFNCHGSLPQDDLAREAKCGTTGQYLP